MPSNLMPCTTRLGVAARNNVFGGIPTRSFRSPRLRTSAGSTGFPSIGTNYEFPYLAEPTPRSARGEAQSPGLDPV